MPLFNIDQGKAKTIQTKEFSNEAELQTLFDKNLEEITGVRLIASQFPIPNGRIDSLGIDEHNVPVVIEYKWGHDPGAIIQGLFYLQWLTQNRKTYELLAKEKFGPIKVNWSSAPRLLIIAKSYDIKELSATDMVLPSVELMRYSFYGNLLSIEDVTVPRKIKLPKGAEPPKEEVVEKTIEDIIEKASPELKGIFYELRNRILELGDEVREKVGGWYIDYRKTSTFATILPQSKNNRLVIYIKMGDKRIGDPKRWSSQIPTSWRYGKLNTQFNIIQEDQLNYAMQLIRQAYEYVP
ncbi:MAG TPA: DUF5655 domain-containing protein [Dehalococcoidia bacterium]|nr:DUF5655 domain-containing protein [Dehalococcoidia bacterium]